jgi:hypothetical protein
MMLELESHRQETVPVLEQGLDWTVFEYFSVFKLEEFGAVLDVSQIVGEVENTFIFASVDRA